jgi:hypothetical protein
MTKEWQAASNEKAIEQKQNPITGTSYITLLGFRTFSDLSFQVSLPRDIKGRATFKVNKPPACPSTVLFTMNGRLRTQGSHVLSRRSQRDRSTYTVLFVLAPIFLRALCWYPNGGMKVMGLVVENVERDEVG